MAMIFIIITQKGLNVNELMFKLDQYENDIKRKEIYLKRFFKIIFMFKIFYIVVLTSIEIACTNLINPPDIYAWLPLSINLFNLTFKTTCFFVLIFLMQKFGNHEYKKIKRTICIYFILDACS